VEDSGGATPGTITSGTPRGDTIGNWTPSVTPEPLIACRKKNAELGAPPTALLNCMTERAHVGEIQHDL
jgi:hypothetical protein